MNTSKGIECVGVGTANNLFIEKIKQTYVDSFPESERRDFSLFKELIEQEDRFCVTVLLQEEKYVGFITAWHFEKFIYIEHFAIDETARNGGIGGKSLKEFLTTCVQPVVLEVELPEEEISKRRIGFYERSGFTLDSNPYRQPPYRKGGEWLDLRLMSYGKIDLSRCYDEVKETLYKEAYKVV